MVNSDVECW